MLSFKKLDVYQFSIKFLALAYKIIDLAQRSIKVSGPVRRAHHYAIARGEAMECSAIIDVIKTTKMSTIKELNEGDLILLRVVAMLTKLCRKN